MPYIDAFTGQIIIAVVTILWGIFIESWYVGRWTIFFNVVPLVVMLMTLELGSFAEPLIAYTVISILLTFVTGHQLIKQIFGAKSYGSLILVMTMFSAGQVSADDILLTWLLYSLGVYAAWFLVAVAKIKISDRLRSY